MPLQAGRAAYQRPVGIYRTPNTQHALGPSIAHTARPRSIDGAAITHFARRLPARPTSASTAYSSPRAPSHRKPPPKLPPSPSEFQPRWPEAASATSRGSAPMHSFGGILLSPPLNATLTKQLRLELFLQGHHLFRDIDPYTQRPLSARHNDEPFDVSPPPGGTKIGKEIATITRQPPPRWTTPRRSVPEYGDSPRTRRQKRQQQPQPQQQQPPSTPRVLSEEAPSSVLADLSALRTARDGALSVLRTAHDDMRRVLLSPARDADGRLIEPQVTVEERSAMLQEEFELSDEQIGRRLREPGMLVGRPRRLWGV